jgi:putative protease
MREKLHKDAGETILQQVQPHDIDFFNKLIEGYDNLALVTTLDEKIGRVALRVTTYAKKDLLAVLKCLPIPVRFITQEG